MKEEVIKALKEAANMESIVMLTNPYSAMPTFIPRIKEHGSGGIPRIPKKDAKKRAKAKRRMQNKARNHK